MSRAANASAEAAAGLSLHANASAAALDRPAMVICRPNCFERRSTSLRPKKPYPPMIRTLVVFIDTKRVSKNYFVRVG